MTSERARLAVHAHFYQPLRADPFTGRVPAEPAAAPFRDWNSRIDAECYRPIGERGTLAKISFDLGPTLAGWMAESAPRSLARFVADGAGRNAIAQAFHHSILPLASASDRRTEIRWGLREFRHRFGRDAEGIWLPETAVDVPTLRAVAAEGVSFTILAPWQAADPNLDSRRPYRVELGGGRSIVVAFYDAALSGAVSFEPAATADADRFARDRIATRLAGSPFPDGQPGLAVIATDGELYGHHQPFRDLFLHRLVAPGPAVPDRGFDVVSLAEAVLDGAPSYRTVRIVERTSWSCHHGVARWHAECPDVEDGRWKAPLRAAFDRLAGAIDATTDAVFAALPGSPDRLAARDEWVDVVTGAEDREAVAARRLDGAATGDDRARFVDLLEAQRWRLAMFASDAWYWDDPVRPETKQAMRCAARAVRLVDAAAGTTIERSLVADLALFTSPGHGLDGAAIYRAALSEVGQPGPAA
ncbi:MAG TPA: DUF3536 domain-containing protein [Candidatus Limnocylindrales bacterium]